MLDRIEYLAQLGRLRMTIPALARKAGLAVNTVRGFLDGKDIRLSGLMAITEALGGEITVSFAKVTDHGISRQESSIDPPVFRLPNRSVERAQNENERH